MRTEELITWTDPDTNEPYEIIATFVVGDTEGDADVPGGIHRLGAYLDGITVDGKITTDPFWWGVVEDKLKSGELV